MSDIEKLEEQDDSMFEALYKCADTLHKVNKDRDFVYDLRKSELKDKDRNARKQKIKSVLIAIGTGAVGVAVGIIIGFFAIK